jgi:hypothetical protein
VVECLLCKEDALGSNPSGSISRTRLRTVSLKWETVIRLGTKNRCTTPRKREWEGWTQPAVDWLVYETVCTCDPGAHWTRFIGLIERSSWLLCHLVDSSAQAPTKDVPSCDKPKGAARRRRTWDLLIGILIAIALRNGERPGLKHLSRGRKRKRMRCR